MTPATFELLEEGMVMPAGLPDTTGPSAATIDAMGLGMLYYGWPGLTRTTQGDLLVTASQRVLHVDPFGRSVLVRSSDLGRTWSKPEVIVDSVSDDRDISLCTMGDGTIIATWFTSDVWARPRPFPYLRDEWLPLRETIKPDTFRMLSRGWLRRSTNHGQSWESLVHPTLVGQFSAPCVTSEDHLLYLGPMNTEDGSVFAVTRSTDGGRSWQVISLPPMPRFFDEVTRKHWSVFNENHALEIAPGKFLVALRGTREHVPMNVHFMRSADGGKTWSPPVDSGAYGYPPTLLRLMDGRILCVFGQRGQVNRIVGMLSVDQGQTWQTDKTFVLKTFTDRHGRDMGYPVAIETQPGEILCIYYLAATPAKTSHYHELDPDEHGIGFIRFKI